MKVAVVVPHPPGYVHVAALYDIAEPLCEGLKALGVDARIEKKIPTDRAIVVGPHLLRGSLPLNAILYNTEQVSPESLWIRSSLLKLYQRHRVWDYDPTNTEALRKLGVNAVTVPPGYAPSMTRVVHKEKKDIDVLFFGSVNARRKKILDAFHNVLTVRATGLYGVARDDAVSRAKIVLNVHYYESKIFEAARVSYLLANRACVVTERSEYMPWHGGYVAVDYDKLVETCLDYLEERSERERIADLGFETFSRHTAADMVQPFISELA